MITVLRGPAAALDAHCARLAAASGLALPLFPPGGRRCWNGVRNLLDGVARQRGRGFVANVLARRPDASSLVPGWFAEAVSAELSLDDRTGQELFAARPTSHLSHNLLIQRPLFGVWAGLLHEVLEGGGFTLLVSDLARLDRESLSALRALYRRFPETAPDLVVGYDPHRADPAPDADGLVWESPVEDVWRIALGFRAMAGARVEDLEGGKDDKDGRDGKDGDGGGADPAEDTGIDTRAWAALAASSGAPAAEEVGWVVEAMRTAFRCFGFTTVVRLGLELLRREPHLTPEPSAEVHGLLGLAAHNRQFLSRRNRVLADLLERHFRAALEAEADPARRSCLCYRLAVTLGRRKGDPEAALEWAERSLAEAAAPGLPSLQAAHLQGWAHNIQAFALLRSGRHPEARFRCQQAFALLDRALESFSGAATSAALAPDQLVREAAFTHSLLADNLAALAKMEGDAEGLAHWKEIADRLGEHFPGLARFEAVTWIEIFRERRELSQALAHAEHGLEDARAEQDALREYEYEVQAADLHDRLGEAAEAYESFERARNLRRRLGSPGFLRRLEAPAATAAARAGKVTQARGLYEALLADGGTGPTARAQILAALAELAARTNRPEEADARMNEAIALAVESGERDALLSVAVTAGRTCRLLGREAEAREAYRRAVDIAGAGGAEAASAPAGLLTSALLGAWETDRDPQLALRALALLPEALEDTSAWWELPRLLRALREVAPPALLADPGLAGPLQDLQTAAAQRADCATALAELRAVLSAA